MSPPDTKTAAREWIAHDPDPQSAAELAACSDDELARRFAHPLRFGTAGLRGPLRAGPAGMNIAVVLRTTWALAQVVQRNPPQARGSAGWNGELVVIGRDARHGSAEFALAAAEVLASEGFHVRLLPAAVPTPLTAFAVRHMRATAGIQITGSHHPSSHSGYKVYFDDGLPIVPPTDRDIEAAIAQAPPADEIARTPVDVTDLRVFEHYFDRVARVRHTSNSLRVALTPLHGVGGEFALEAMAQAHLRLAARRLHPVPVGVRAGVGGRRGGRHGGVVAPAGRHRRRPRHPLRRDAARP